MGPLNIAFNILRIRVILLIVLMASAFVFAPVFARHARGSSTSSQSLTLQVSGTNILRSGIATPLRGANLQGLEASMAQGYQPWYGSPPSPSLANGWNFNTVRIPINAASILGLSCLTINGSGTGWTSLTPASADPFGNAVAALDTAIATWQAAGDSVIIDLHWSAPKLTFSGTTAYAMPLGQPPFANADTDIALWTFIANRYGTQATPITVAGIGTIDNTNIIFELFNEPYLDRLSGYGNNSTTWGIAKNGGVVSSFQMGGIAVAQSWTAAGFQQMLNTVRGTGAKNIILAGGLGYAAAVSGYASFMPVDSLVPAQVGIAAHPYPYGSASGGTYSGGGYYPETYPDSGGGTSSWDTPALAIIAANIPYVITEDGGSFSSGQSIEQHVSYMTSFATANNVAGYISWTFWQETGASSGTNQLLTTSGTPTSGQGTVFQTWSISQ